MGRNQRYYYAVQKGKQQGVYSTWDECKSNVNGYSGAKYKKFDTMEEAQAFVNQSSSSSSKNNNDNHSPPSSTSSKRTAPPIVSSPGRSVANHTTSDRSNSSETPTTAIKRKHSPTSSSSSPPHKTPKTESSAGYVVYTDGASRGNGRKGAKAGYGIWWGDGDARNISGPLDGDKQTNQRAEATAILKVLEQTQHMRDRLEIHTDSQYCIKAMTEWNKKWVKNDWKSSTGVKVQNRDLFEPMLNLVKSRKGKTEFIYVPGHKGIYGNEQADALAVAGAESNCIIKKEK